ncbi:hypothetical protein GIB67_019967 [Kingdonia uniflora]|uniref:Uncharacterized protein n=1 Tax=Kingdonia uniflora TaxID=39325 RepID=A0A7J7MKP3_9MAGN|nr:hypothetical protein GIB67_019967 [Kingdonia uniflora]
MLYDPPEKLHCFPTSDVVRSLQAMGWIEAQYYIMSHHVDYDAFLRHVSLGALMSDIARCRNIDIPGLGALTSGGIVVDLEDDEGEAGTSQAGTSRGRG